VTVQTSGEHRNIWNQRLGLLVSDNDCDKQVIVMSIVKREPRGFRITVNRVTTAASISLVSVYDLY